MSDLDAVDSQVQTWLQPLSDEGSPCGEDLEYDNAFLALNQAAVGKPESQFGAAEPPDWRGVVAQVPELFERTRDLRVAVLALRGWVHMLGFAGVAPGLALINGLIEQHWEQVHPLPDPDDGDPYARVNALTLLRETDGLLGDLRTIDLVADRSIGAATVRQIEVAAGLSPLRSGESELARETLTAMLGARLERDGSLRENAQAALAGIKQLIAQLNDKLGVGAGPDLRPTYALLKAVLDTLPAPAEAVEEGAGDGEVGEVQAGAAAAPRKGLSGGIHSRAEAIRAIDMICKYLEQAEPSNPAQLFLRRAEALINHNFLQLMKVLAPDALSEVARTVGIDPDSIETPGGS